MGKRRKKFQGHFLNIHTKFTADFFFFSFDKKGYIFYFREAIITLLHGVGKKEEPEADNAA